MNFACVNGKFLPAREPQLSVQNRAYKWGDGLFETIRVHKGKILLEHLHFDRLFRSLNLLGMDKNELHQQDLAAAILTLCKKNNCLHSARVRLAIYREESNLPGFTIEASPLPLTASEWNKKGWNIGVFPHARKTQDAYANLKTSSFLPYVLAARFAQEHLLDDVLLLNTSAAFCDASRANIFIWKSGELHTPALDQGCVAGVMRRFIIEECPRLGIPVHQDVLTENDLYEADEIFLTNAIQGIKGVGSFGEKIYAGAETEAIARKLMTTISG